MNTHYYNYLRNIIPRLIPSESMKNYLKVHVECIAKWKIITPIINAPIALTEKQKIYQNLSSFENIGIENQEDEGSFTLYEKLTTEVINDLQPSENSVFLLETYKWKEPVQNLTECTLFCTIEEVMRFIETEYSKDDLDHMWHFLYKWERTANELMQIREYTIVNNQICYFGYEQNHYLYFCAHSADLNLPVPFKTGDFVITDGRPFCGKSIAMITGVGNNLDCCSLQDIYMDYEGNLAYGALKHASVFEAQGGFYVSANFASLPDRIL